MACSQSGRTASAKRCVGGATTPDKPVSGKGSMLSASDIKASGFLKDYTQLQPVPGRQYAWRYVRPGVDWKQYNEICVAPLEVWVSPEADQLGIQPAFYTEIDRSSKQIVTQEFQSHGYQDTFTWVVKTWRETLDRAKGVSG